MGGRECAFNSKMALNYGDVQDLALSQLSPTFTTLIFGDYTKWCSSLIYYPFDLSKGDSSRTRLRVMGTDLNVGCYLMDTRHDQGYSLGQYHYEGTYNDFRDYEPYSSLEIYLPFYGIVSVPIADVINKYIQILLNVDFMSGRALYTIGVNANSVSTPNAPFAVGRNDSLTEIIAKYSFNLGTVVPIGQTGMTDAIRNTVMGVANGAVSVASRAIGSIGEGSSSDTTKKITETMRNPETGRQITTATRTVETERSTVWYNQSRNVADCFDTAMGAIQAMNVRASNQNGNGSFVDPGSPRSVKIIRRTVDLIKYSSGGVYEHLFGKPLGQTRPLNAVHGYTEVSAIHFEGSGFASATNKEMAMIQDEFSRGVILP